MEVNQLYNLRQRLTQNVRREYHEKKVLESRIQIWNNLFPLHSQTLSDFQYISSNELEYHEEKIVRQIASEDLQNLSKNEYENLLRDIFYLVSNKKFKLPYIEFRWEEDAILPDIIANYYSQFHCDNVAEWMEKMDLDMRLFLYASFVEMKEDHYIKEQTILCASRDLDHNEALKIIEYCLFKGIKSSCVKSHTIKRLINIFNSDRQLTLIHLHTIYYIALRSTHEFYFQELKSLVIKNQFKFCCQNELQKMELDITLLKMKSLKPRQEKYQKTE